MIVCLSLTISPSVLMNITMGEHCTLDRLFDVENFTMLTLLSLLVSYKISFPVVI
jgi:hypothetical protein